MRVLFVHQNFPGQYKHVAAALAREPNNDVVAMATTKHPVPPGVHLHLYEAKRVQPGSHPLAADFDSKVRWGEATARAALKLKADGFTPDIICGHPGWGEMLFLRDVWPDTHILSFMEFFFNGRGSDFDFDRSSPIDVSEFWKLRIRNAPLLLSIQDSDWCVSPTRWQWSQLPDFARARTSVIHDGIDTATFKPDAKARVVLGRDSIECKPGDEVITFVNRNLEPYRGFHMFMRALPDILARRPNARAVIVGGDGVSYGKAPPPGVTWKSLLVKEVAPRVDFSRVHFVGQIPYQTYLSLLQVSAVHVYLTYPFVLSWSMLEAMAAGCLVVGSNTGPVVEVIDDGRNGLLVDFASVQELADMVVRTLAEPDSFRHLRDLARKTIVDRYDLHLCLPLQLELISAVAQGKACTKRVGGLESASGNQHHRLGAVMSDGDGLGVFGTSSEGHNLEQL